MVDCRHDVTGWNVKLEAQVTGKVIVWISPGKL